MEDIKVGEYVRTEDGYIGVYDGDPSGNEYLSYDRYSGKIKCEKKRIIKHSPNIIGLIEVRRYIRT